MTTQKSPAQSLADVMALCVSTDDVAGLLVALLDECAAALSADAVGLVVTTDRGELELLSSTSHEAAHLEFYQVQQSRGPCIEVLHTGAPIAAVSAQEISSRWPEVGQVVIAAGFGSLHAVPVQWHRETYGVLTLLFRHEPALTDDQARLQQAFANVASLAIVTPSPVTIEMLRQRVEQALLGRAVIEQAKGVLRYRHGLSYAAAYGDLVRRAAGADHSLTEVAQEVLRSVQPGAAGH